MSDCQQIQKLNIFKKGKVRINFFFNTLEVPENCRTYTNNFMTTDMKKAKTIITIGGVLMLLFSYENMSAGRDYPRGATFDKTSSKSTQTVTKSPQTTSKTKQTTSKSKKVTSKSTQTSPKTVPIAKPKDTEIVRIGTQNWAIANLNVITFRNGDSIPQAKTNKEWVAAGDAGKPAWCYYNNDPAIGLKYGKLYNWFAVNDPRGLAPAGWNLPTDAEWSQLINYLGKQGAPGSKMKSSSRWSEGNNGTNESGFNGFPGGYRIENGAFSNAGSIGIWWSSTEVNTLSAVDHYLSQSSSVGGSSSPKPRGESVRCLKQ
jgi:uncharacterized protein (TIGR02145 family)